jgi:hypothetical protein
LGTAEPVLAELQASEPRRLLGVTIITALGGLLIYLALWHPPATIMWRVFLLGFGAIALYGGRRLWQDTMIVLELTKSELREKDGRLVTRIADIRDVSRGALAMKPSNGFSMSLTKSHSFVWAPGLWWRFGKQIGIGGVTPSAQSKVMAEQIALLVAMRED